MTDGISPALSVIIPTYRRLDTLPRVLAEVERQAALVPGGAEIVVCDDSSQDGTKEFLNRFAHETRCALNWLSLERNRGPAAARNAALARARGSAVLIIGDDIVPASGLLACHAAWHTTHPEETAGLLGFCTWPTELAADPFLRWLEHGGRRYFFNYRDIPTNRPISGMYFYTCNVSCKRQLLERVGGFDESFPFASHEDLELGMRLENAGLRLWFDRAALAHHWHRLTFNGTLRRIYRMGYSSVNFWKRVSDPAGPLKRCARGALTTLCGINAVKRTLIALSTSSTNPPRILWSFVLMLAYWHGVADGRKGRVDAALAGGAR